MFQSICGIDCAECTLNNVCGGCVQTNGHPFGGECVVAMCCQHKGLGHCTQCPACQLREQLIAEFNALGIEDMDEVTSLHALKGSFINLEYTFANGQSVKLLEDEKIYLGNQLCKKGSARFYGLAADEHCLLVCEYGAGGSEPEMIRYQKRNG